MENGNGHATETTEQSGLAETKWPNPPTLTDLLLAAHGMLDVEMETTPCNQTEAARHAVKSALECLDARNKDRVSAAKG